MNTLWAIILSTLVLLISYILYSEIDIHDTIELDPNTDAKCLDGSNYKFELSRGFGEGIDKFIFYFEGGGWCLFNREGYDYEDCLKRTNISWGSSKPLFSKSIRLSRLFYILSPKKKHNPVFYNWNKILVRYCDGFGHQGYLEKPINYNGVDLYVRGYNNTMGIVNYLKDKHFGLMTADKVVLSGHSAGGTAALYWTNYIRSKLGKKTKMYTIADSGFFLDVPTNTEKGPEHKLKELNIKSFNLTNPDVNNDFFSSYCSGMEGWKCYMAEYFIQNIEVPVLLLHSLYDSWSIYRLVGEDCIFKHSKMLLYCNKTEHIEEYKNKLVSYFQNLDKTNRQIYFWLTNCITHSFLYATQDVYSAEVGINGLSLAESIDIFINRQDEYKNVIENRNFDIKICENVKDLYFYVNYFGYPTS
jgi:hypothetical protein